MNILAFCCALNNTYLALQYDDFIKTETIKSDSNYHSLYLLENIKKLFDENNFKFKNLDMIAVNTGPGSFTGIRVALVVAKVMAGELDIPIVGLNTAEILLKAYSADILLMDARRDMYYLGDNQKIELIYKEKIEKYKDKKVVCDARCKGIIENSICFEENDYDIGRIILELAKEKYESTKNKEQFNPLNVKANYIQTPPVFC